jgi:hypothetical protein
LRIRADGPGRLIVEKIDDQGDSAAGSSQEAPV